VAKPGPTKVDEEVGRRIRARRKELGVTQAALAQALGLTFQQVQKYERGANRCSSGVLVKIAKRLDAPVSYLLGEEGDRGHDQIPPRALASAGAVELLEVYARIPNSAARKALLNVATALAAG